MQLNKITRSTKETGNMIGEGNKNLSPNKIKHNKKNFFNQTCWTMIIENVSLNMLTKISPQHGQTWCLEAVKAKRSTVVYKRERLNQWYPLKNGSCQIITSATNGTSNSQLFLFQNAFKKLRLIFPQAKTNLLGKGEAFHKKSK